MASSGGGDPKLVTVGRSAGAEAAVVFVHGFGGGVGGTWGRLPSFVARQDGLREWDLYDLGYTTSLAPDVRGTWAADPGLDVLARFLRTKLHHEPLKSYRSLELVAHSMGGLVVQRAVVDDRDLASRIGHVFLFGTPSGGLKKAGRFAFWKRSIRDMDRDSAFITDLRTRWDQQFPARVTRPFRLWAVAGDRDEFVPAESSLMPFADRDRWVIDGNHIEIVKPEHPDAISVKLVAEGLLGDAAPAGPWNSARVAVQTNDFQCAVDLLEPNADQLDDRRLVELALAVASLRSTEGALAILRARPSLRGDAAGVLAGRLKRRWATEGREDDGTHTLTLYRDAYQDAVADGDDAQAFYHGINVAFLQVAFERDVKAARETAEQVLKHTATPGREDHWRLATIGEAKLHLGDADAALDAYRQAIAQSPRPWQMRSMYTQGTALACELGLDEAEPKLARIFREGADDDDV